MEENDAPTPPRGLNNRERIRLAFAILVGAVFGISCMSFSIERNANEMVPDSNNTVKQHGSLILTENPDELKIYYPRSFVTPPNLKIDAGSFTDDIVLVEQKEDHFTLHLKRHSPSRAVEWFAQGVPTPLPTPPLVTAPPAVVEITPPPAPAVKDKILPPPPEPIEISPSPAKDK